ncbi:MAG: hypothetical protein ACPGED_07395, partial [Flavobacteriales bacterium]
MRKLYFIALVVLLAACGSEPKEVGTDMLHFPKSAEGGYDEDMPVISFEEETYQFDRIIEGAVLKHS